MRVILPIYLQVQFIAEFVSAVQAVELVSFLFKQLFLLFNNRVEFIVILSHTFVIWPNLVYNVCAILCLNKYSPFCIIIIL